jgi:hypothetical protein
VTLRHYEFGAADAYGDEAKVLRGGSPHSQVPALLEFNSGGTTGRDAGRTVSDYTAVVYLPTDHDGVSAARGTESDGPPSVVETEGEVLGFRYGNDLWGSATYSTTGVGERYRVHRVLYEQNGLAALGVVRA